MKHTVLIVWTVMVVLVTSTAWATTFDHDEHVAILEGEDCSNLPCGRCAKHHSRCRYLSRMP